MLLIIGRVWRHLSISRPPESASRALFFIASDIGTCSFFSLFFTFFLLSTFSFLHMFSPSLSCSRSSPCSKTQPGPSPADQWLSRGKRTGEGKKALYRCGLKSSEEQRLTQGWWRRMALLKHLGPYQTILGPCRTILGPYHTIWWPYSTTWVCLSTP